MLFVGIVGIVGIFFVWNLGVSGLLIYYVVVVKVMFESWVVFGIGVVNFLVSVMFDKLVGFLVF